MKAKSVAFFLASLFSCGGALADISKSGAEFQVNSFSDGYQREPRVAAIAEGEFVVVWIGPPADGVNERDVMGRFVDAQGAQTEFQINAYTTNTENNPAVAADANGNFVVVWVTADRDGDDYGVFGQRFSAAGLPVGTEFQANTTTTEDQRRAALAMSADGVFMVVWQSTDQDGDSGGIFGRRFGADATPLGTEFQVNAFTTGSQYLPQIEALTGGGFVVAWGSTGQDDASDGFSAGVFAQRFGGARGLHDGHAVQRRDRVALGRRLYDGVGGFRARLLRPRRVRSAVRSVRRAYRYRIPARRGGDRQSVPSRSGAVARQRLRCRVARRRRRRRRHRLVRTRIRRERLAAGW